MAFTFSVHMYRGINGFEFAIVYIEESIYGGFIRCSLVDNVSRYGPMVNVHFLSVFLHDVLGFQEISINDREHITLVVCIFFKYFNVLT